MTYTIEYENRAVRDLSKLPARERRRVILRIERLAEDPKGPGTSPLKHDLKGRYKLRVGSYRVVYSIEHSKLVVAVMAAGHRRDVYEILRRRD